jgi:hypothetical protein
MHEILVLPRRKHLAALLAATLGGVGAAHAGAPPAFVTSCLDDNSPGTLRSVVAAAAGGSIDLYTQSNCSTITLTQGEIVLPLASVTLLGHAGAPNVVAAPGSRVLRQPAGVTAVGSSPVMVISGLTISGGRVYSAASGVALGGCIAGDSVNLVDSTVSDCLAASAGGDASGGAVSAVYVGLHHSRIENSAAFAAGDNRTAHGGGVYAAQGVVCRDSTITGNHVAVKGVGQGVGEGGGIFGVYELDIAGCTVDHNSADRGGGLVVGDTTNAISRISNSTISSNTATTAVGGSLFRSSVNFYNSTVAFNSAPTCGGVTGVGLTTLQSTIVANNRSGTTDCVDFYSYITDGANNLITVAGNSPVPPGTIDADPMLTPLADHGGPTFTHGLSLSSPAIDRGNNGLLLSTDQRGAGFVRVVGSAADIGAFERQPDDEEVFFGGFE